MRVDKFLGLWRDGIGLVLTKADSKIDHPALELSEEEKAVFADPAMVRKILDVDIIGNVMVPENSNFNPFPGGVHWHQEFSDRNQFNLEYTICLQIQTSYHQHIFLATS